MRGERGALGRRYHPGQALWAQWELAPEVGLAIAIVRQVLHDVHSPRPDVRSEARTFIEHKGLDYWQGLLGIELDLTQMARATLQLPCEDVAQG